MKVKFIPYIFAFVFFIALAFTCVFPIFSVFINSLTDPNTANLSLDDSSKIFFLPFPISLNQYFQAVILNRETTHFFWNTVLLTVPIMLGTLVISLLSGYALCKFNFRFKRVIFFCYVLLMLLPIQINVIGSYLFFDDLGLIGSRWGVILPGIFSSFGAFLIYQFLKSVPYDIMESGRLDGAGEIRIFLSLVIPNIKAGIASMLILVLIDCWNMVEMPMVILAEESLYPLSITIRYLGESSPQLIFATTIIFTLPVFLVFIFLRNDLSRGIVQSGQIKK